MGGTSSVRILSAPETKYFVELLNMCADLLLDRYTWLARGASQRAELWRRLGDFVTFSRHMKRQAGNMGVDLLLIDTGRLPKSDGKSLGMTFSIFR
jgi:hypothetical protein